MNRLYLALFLLFSFSAKAQQPTLSQLSEYWQVAPQAPAKVESPQFSQQNFTEKSFPYVPLTYGTGIPARRGATGVAFPYPEGIKDESFTKDQDDKKLLAILEEKKPTAARFFAADISMPDHFSTSNNLAKKVGSFYRAFGEIIFIKGTIVDSFGVPIEGAVVEIWQANAAGKYHTLLDPDSEYIDKYFNMSGRAITDNFGQYDFITIMPGSNPGRAPHINMNIYHQRFGKLETEMYFEEHPYNASDYQYLAYDKEDRELLTAKVRRTNFRDKNSIKICTFNIVMRGIHQYKKY
ncbi:MAG: hypothetical protein EBS06_04355 [Proteobacteria bacterium]|nr:hypothetical protein [Pseudomonadota bacterium]